MNSDASNNNEISVQNLENQGSPTMKELVKHLITKE